jgi:hypothetical protein
MQTFLPYSDFRQSVQALDNKRLGKQRVECFQIINILEGKNNSNAWVNHPAIKMWEGYTYALQYYYNCCIDEWKRRGFKNTMNKYSIRYKYDNPWWVGYKDFHRAMRAKLIEKNEEFYLPIFGEIDKGFNNSKYLWPVNETNTFRMI